ncbi:4Fe-4S dicluster domain-containing protein [Myxococcota bacterium]|nr:4Fe-4S dicluster domain-containing protein [Myxococcota bacterium]MBU1537746.1 4Fe-4S dicluster domain-containing protein [Myxococcota bacterium]
MNKHLTFNGGRTFKFAHSPTSSDITPLKTTSIGIPLTTQRYRFIPISRSQTHYDAYEPVVRCPALGNLTYGYPAPLSLNGSSADGSVMLFSLEEEPRPLPEGSLREKFLQSGIWLEIRNLLTGGIVHPGVTPRRVFIATFLTEPYSATIDTLLRDFDLGAGIAALFALLGETIQVTVLAPDVPGTPGTRTIDCKNPQVDTLFLPNRYPAHDGTIPLTQHIYPTEIAKDPDKYWWMDTQTLKKITGIVNELTIDFNITVALGGSLHRTPGHYSLLPFTVLSTIAVDIPKSLRVITGGLLTGHEAVNPEEYSVRPWDRGVALLENPDTREMLHFLRPGLSRDSISPTFLSWFFRKKERSVHGGIRGERRYCVSCNYCETMCPLSLDPQHLFKLASRNILDEAASQGLLRCSGCGICSYVCPSKLELSPIISAGKAAWLKETGGSAS